jgi:hypothetical protein
MRTIHHDDDLRQDSLRDLGEIARAGARKMLTEALEAEVQVYLKAAAGQLLLSKSGKLPPHGSQVGDTHLL